MPENSSQSGLNPEDPGPEGDPLVLSAVIYEIGVLIFGMITGFFWCMYNTEQFNATETINVIIGLMIFVMILSRYIYRVKILVHRSDMTTVTRDFAMELSVYILGLITGFFWYSYYNADGCVEVHVIMTLLVVIYGMIRSLKIITSRTQ
jgi:hypothetical protein